jgi:hypothetical protein
MRLLETRHEFKPNTSKAGSLTIWNHATVKGYR